MPSAPVEAPAAADAADDEARSTLTPQRQSAETVDIRVMKDMKLPDLTKLA